MGKDHTLFAKATGAVKFVTRRNDRTYVEDRRCTGGARPNNGFERAAAHDWG